MPDHSVEGGEWVNPLLPFAKGVRGIWGNGGQDYFLIFLHGWYKFMKMLRGRLRFEGSQREILIWIWPLTHTLSEGEVGKKSLGSTSCTSCKVWAYGMWHKTAAAQCSPCL